MISAALGFSMLVGLSGVAYGHAGLEETSPKAGAVLPESDDNN